MELKISPYPAYKIKWGTRNKKLKTQRDSKRVDALPANLKTWKKSVFILSSAGSANI